MCISKIRTKVSFFVYISLEKLENIRLWFIFLQSIRWLLGVNQRWQKYCCHSWKPIIVYRFSFGHNF